MPLSKVGLKMNSFMPEM